MIYFVSYMTTNDIGSILTEIKKEKSIKDLEKELSQYLGFKVAIINVLPHTIKPQEGNDDRKRNYS